MTQQYKQLVFPPTRKVSSQSQLSRVSLSSLAQLGRGHLTRYYLSFQLYNANLSLFMSYVNLILNHLLWIKKVSSLTQFLSYMNEEDIFDSFPGIKNVITSDLIRAVSYLHNRQG